MFGPVRTILVDDKPRHLIAISSGLAAARIPCMPYWYDRDELSLTSKLKPSPPEGGHPYVRIVFTDLNLEESTPSDIANVISPAVAVIKQLVGSNPGPYVVVFWTVMTFDIADIRAELIARLKSNDVPLPVAVDEIPKGQFIEADVADKQGDHVLESLYAALHRRGDQLRQEVESVLSKYGLLNMLAGWETRAFSAAGDAIGHLHSTALQGQLPDEDLDETIAKVAALVSREAVGGCNASDDPARAFDAAMLDVLTDTFGRSVADPDYSGKVASVLGQVQLDNIELSGKEAVYATLNTIQHLDTEPISSGAVQRGQIVRLDDAIQAGFPIDSDEICRWEDFFYDPRKDDSSRSPLTKVSEATVRRFREVVRQLNQAVDGLVLKAIAKLRQERNADLKASYTALKAGKAGFASAVEWVLIEIGADCDHTQRKSRTIRYLVGAIVPADGIGDYVLPAATGRLRNDALRLLGPFELSGQLVHLLISLKRFVVWQKPEHAVPPDPYLRLRAATVDYLLSCYAAWSTRPGMVEFR